MVWGVWTRTLLWIVGVLTLVVAGPNAYLGMLGSRAQRQITPVEDVQWPGLEIHVESRRVEGSSPDLAMGGCCLAPLLFLFFLAIRADRRAARGREDVPTSF